MGRKSKRTERRAQIVEAFARVFADHGYAGATIAAVAAEADVAPGLLHHNFDNKREMLGALLAKLVADFRDRVATREAESDSSADPLLAYIDGALTLDDGADLTAARCWVGVFAEAVRNPRLMEQARRLIDAEIATIRRRSGDLSEQEASAVLAFIIGALVMGAFAPQRTAGFAAPALRRLVGRI